jgi:hypothetical protein
MPNDFYTTIIKKVKELRDDVNKLLVLETTNPKDVIKAVAALPTPSADLTGFRRHRTSDNIEFFCDGSRWLSTELFSHPIEILFDGAIAGVYPHVITTPGTFYVTASLPNIPLSPEELYLKLWQQNAGSGTVFYSWTLNSFGLTGTPNQDTKTIAAATWTGYKYTKTGGNFVNSTATPAVDPANLVFTVTGATGKFLLAGLFRYRMVG